ncbi:MAG: hypothetical protein M3N54_04190 [Acidobacteriota bacterium]|nr:hypothetical protein [Acidobacteriota bacterium]
MAQHSVDEVFRTIAFTRRRGIPNPPPIAEGFAGSSGDLTSSMSQVGAEIAQLRASYQQQHDLIVANTQAVQSNTSSKGGTSATATLGHVASGLFGGALGILSPLVTGLLGLFGGGSSAPAPLPYYSAPPPISLDGILRAPAASGSQQSATAGAAGQQNGSAAQTTYSPQITVQVNAMDSQSFMDRSNDIANAVREAMLNNHPINGVVTDL